MTPAPVTTRRVLPSRPRIHAPRALTAAREAVGWTLAELSRASTIPITALMAYEAGTRRPHGSDLHTLEALLDLHPERGL